ncbi:hypothetical protein [Streptomyces sp. TLI_55]|uniref:hypothetical protein n=1 Tax=Streptomyces sp. TLI_55 TaxID=1938861 RepID=UPI00211C2298|nr:hypothetical protein [Streptomyces sp. TLI_55]
MHELGLRFGLHIMRGIPRRAVAARLPVAGTDFAADEIADTDSVLGQLRENAIMWRVCDDPWDRWEDVEAQFSRMARWAPWQGERGWADADMLPLGRIGIRAERGEDRMSRLTHAEQISRGAPGGGPGAVDRRGHRRPHPLRRGVLARRRPSADRRAAGLRRRPAR